jgi:Zn-finger protein
MFKLGYNAAQTKSLKKILNDSFSKKISTAIQNPTTFPLINSHLLCQGFFYTFCFAEKLSFFSAKVGGYAWSCSNLSSFHRLTLVKILRPERLLDAVRTMIKEHLGSLFVSPPPLDLQEIFAESDPKVPLIFILAPGLNFLKVSIF